MVLQAEMDSRWASRESDFLSEKTMIVVRTQWCLYISKGSYDGMENMSKYPTHII